MESSARIRPMVKCTCNYKCRWTKNAFQMVSKSTFYEHNLHDLRGEVAQGISTNDLEAQVNPQGEAHVLCHPEEARTMRQEVVNENANALNLSQGEKQKVWCDCTLSCNGGRNVPRSTFSRHQKLQASLNLLRRELHLSPPRDIPCEGSSFACVSPLHDENVASLMHDEDIASPVHDEDAASPMQGENAEVEMTIDKDVSVFTKIIERIVDLQSLWDEHQVSIDLQNKMLHLLFGDLGGPRVGPRKDSIGKESLGKLLVQLPSNWMGDLDGLQVPACWDQLNAFLKGFGMPNKQRYRICMGLESNAHEPELFYPSNEDNYTKNLVYCECIPGCKKLKRDCETCCERCQICGSLRKDMLSFDYVPVGDQLKLLVKCRSFCHDFLSMWRMRENWLGKDPDEQPEVIRDFWDGSKCKELQDFWNPSAQYELPVVCSNLDCRKKYSTFPTKSRSKFLDKSWNEVSQSYNIVCTICRTKTNFSKKTCHGDPRNFALLLHWDGFQASRTTQKDCGVVEIKILNATKGIKLEVLPVLFIPFSCEKIIRNSGDVFGTFLKPLIEELESLYIDGIDVVYNYPLNKIFENTQNAKRECKVRVMLMMITGDHPAQCKIGLFKDGGQFFCRRDKAQATLDASNPRFLGRYVYDGNRKQARYPPIKRNILEMVGALEDARLDITLQAKENRLKKVGLSGESIIWRLHDLYGFDLSLDLVYDSMHVFSLNIFKKYTSSLFSNDATPSLRKDIDDAVLKVRNAIPPRLRHGRWPKSPSKYHESFKAEENQKFIQWCLPYVLRTVEGIPQVLKELGVLLIDIAHSFFNFSRDNGWSKESMNVVRTLLKAWRIRKEECLGPNSSPLEHVAGNGEILDDVLRHGLHDIFWCYIFERKVSIYIAIKTNNLDNEKTYVSHYSRLLCTKTFQAIQDDNDNILPNERLLQNLHKYLIPPSGFVIESSQFFACQSWHKDGILEVQSIAKAKTLWSQMQKYGEGCQCKNLMKQKGIAITPKRRVTRDASVDEISYAKEFWAIDDEDMQVFQVTCYKSILFNGELYKIGNDVVVEVDHDQEQPCHTVGHWKAHILSIFSMQYKQTWMVFFGAEYYNQCRRQDDNGENLRIDETTGMSVVENKRIAFSLDCIRPISSLLHKAYLLPIPSQHKSIFYEIKDLKPRSRLLEDGHVGNVPPWLEVDDVVKAFKNPSEIMRLHYAVVRDVNYESKEVRLAFLKLSETNQSYLNVEDEEGFWRSWKCCVKQVSGWSAVRRQRVIHNGSETWFPIEWRS